MRPADVDLALVRLLEPRDAAQGRRLAAAGRAEQREELVLGALERDAVHGDDAPARRACRAAKRFDEDLDTEQRRRSQLSGLPASSRTRPRRGARRGTATIIIPSAASSVRWPSSYCSQILIDSTSLPGE